MSFTINVVNPKGDGLAKDMKKRDRKVSYNPRTGGIVLRKGKTDKYIEITPSRFKTVVFISGDTHTYLEIYSKENRITFIDDFGNSSGMGIPYNRLTYWASDYPYTSGEWATTEMSIVNNDNFIWNVFSFTAFRWKLEDPDWYADFEEDYWPDDNGYTLTYSLAFDDQYYYSFLSKGGNDYLYKGSIVTMAQGGDPQGSYHANIAISDVTADDLSLFYNTLYGDGEYLYACRNAKVGAAGMVGIRKYNASDLSLVSSKDYYPLGTQKLLTQISGDRTTGLLFLYVRDNSDVEPMEVLTISAEDLSLIGSDTITFENANTPSGEYSGTDGDIIWANQISWLNADVADRFVYFDAWNTTVGLNEYHGGSNKSLFRVFKTGGVAEIFVEQIQSFQTWSSVFAKSVDWG